MSVSASGGGVRSAYDAAVTAVAAVGGGFSMQHRIRRPLMTPGVVVVSSSRPPPARRRRAVDASPGLQRRNDDGYIRSTANPRTVRPLPSQQHQQPISFEPSFPRPLEPPEPDLDGRKPPDERKVKLGKSRPTQAPATLGMSHGSSQTNRRRSLAKQPSASSKSAFRHFSCIRCRRRFSRQTSRSTSSLRHTRTCRRCRGG